MLWLTVACASSPEVPSEPEAAPLDIAAERALVEERVSEIVVLLRTEKAMGGHYVSVPRPEVELGPRPHAWVDHPGWRKLRYEAPAESLCVYWIDVASDQHGWMVWGICDMDGDGVEAMYGKGHVTGPGKWHSEEGVL